MAFEESQLNSLERRRIKIFKFTYLLCSLVYSIYTLWIYNKISGKLFFFLEVAINKQYFKLNFDILFIIWE